MDRTRLFLLCVEEVRKDGVAPNQTDSKHKADFAFGHLTSRGKDIICSLTKLKCVLLETRKQYANSTRHFDVEMEEDYKWQKTDAEAQLVIQQCNQLFGRLKREMMARKCSSRQLIDHKDAILETIEAYLKGVAQLHSEQRALRIKRAVDIKKLSRLATLVRSSSIADKPCSGILTLQRLNRSDSSDSSEHISQKIQGLEVSDNSNNVEWPEMSTQSSSKLPNSTAVGSCGKSSLRNRKLPPKFATKITSGTVSKNDHPGLSPNHNRMSTLQPDLEPVSDPDLNLTPAEEQQLQKENDTLYSELNKLVDEMEQIEGKVIEIAKLQEIFTEKILTQDQDVQRIHVTAINSTENVKGANEQIRDAMKRKATTRVYMMFILIVLTFTILFLDWYNP